MTAGDPALPPARGLVDREGRLVEADPRLRDLNARAGGSIGGPLAIPQIATLARLAQRLAILISRNVIAADGDDDIDLWVRCEPDAAGVRLSITGWRARGRWQPVAAISSREHDFIRTASDWRWETDATLRLTFVSPGAGARYGFDDSAMLGQPMTRLFVLDGEAHAGKEGEFPLLVGLALRRSFQDQPATLRGTTRAIRLSAQPRTDNDGAFSGFVGGVHLVAPVIISPVENDSVSTFATQLDGALRLPLERIIANADSISAEADGPLPVDYAGYANDIANAGRHLMGLVDDLVDLQTIERPEFDVTIEQLDLADIARRAAGLLTVRAAQGRVRIDPPDADEVLMASGEFRRALQVLVNLVGNAVRYSPPEGMVWMRAEREGDVAAIIVADQGQGIATEDQARIFEKFERVDSRDPSGSGLGLYIARRLARAMGGDVTVDSAPGQGARFVFTLPC